MKKHPNPLRRLAITIALPALLLLPTLLLATPGEIPLGGVLRNVPMQGLTGNSLLLSEYRGKPLVINIWASYCPPCLAEMGSLERLSRRFAGEFNVIGISIDDYADRAKAFLAKTSTSFPHYIDHQLTLENMLGGDRVPLTVLVDAQGKVLEKHYGAREWDAPEAIALVTAAFGIRGSKQK